MLKIAIVVILVLIIASLGSGLFFLSRDTDQGTRMVKSLTIRIVLSIVLFLLVVIGGLTGTLQPHGL